MTDVMGRTLVVSLGGVIQWSTHSLAQAAVYASPTIGNIWRTFARPPHCSVTSISANCTSPPPVPARSSYAPMTKVATARLRSSLRLALPQARLSDIARGGSAGRDATCSSITLRQTFPRTLRTTSSKATAWPVGRRRSESGSPDDRAVMLLSHRHRPRAQPSRLYVHHSHGKADPGPGLRSTRNQRLALVEYTETTNKDRAPFR